MFEEDYSCVAKAITEYHFNECDVVCLLVYAHVLGINLAKNALFKEIRERINCGGN